MENLLKNERSPYLKQHENYPVHWYPWGTKALKKAKELKLDNQVHFELCDYRTVKGKFEKIVSVGAFEHFGKKFKYE